MEKNKLNSKKIIIKKQIVFSKQFNTFASVFFIVLICLNFFGLLYLIDTVSSIKNDTLNLNKRIEKVENDNYCFNNIDEEINNYYRELSDKTDEAIDRILTIVGLLATAITFFGILLTFKAPKDLEKKIDENKDLLVGAEKAAEDAKYQAEIIEALNVDYSGEITNRKRLQQISKIIKEYPEKPDAYMHRAFLYDKIAKESHKKEYLHLAISDFEVAYKLGADAFSYYNDMGVAYSKLHDYDKAIKYYTKAIKKDPEDIVAYVNRGNDYDNIGEYQKALDDFEKALQIDLDYYDAYLGRNYTYEHLWKIEQDLEKRNNYIQLQWNDLKHAIEINPENNDPKDLLKELINELCDKQIINKDTISIMFAETYEKIGDLEKEGNKYDEAFKYYIDAILRYTDQFLFHGNVNVKHELIRIISKLYDVNSDNIKPHIIEMKAQINKFCQIMRAMGPLLYENGEQDAAEKLFILLKKYDDNDKDIALNLAFMKRRCETKYVEESTIELLNSCVNQKSVVWCMNKALCYVDGIDVDVDWHKAIEILDNSETDTTSAVDWWSQVNVVGEKENNIAFLLFALSKKHNVTDSLSLEERISRAQKDGYNIPEDLSD